MADGPGLELQTQPEAAGDGPAWLADTRRRRSLIPVPRKPVKNEDKWSLAFALMREAV